MSTKSKEFEVYRERMNKRISELDNLVVNRFFNLDSRTYEDGALSGKIKELLGLVSSAVLRCDDCIMYHLGKCKEMGWTTKEVTEALSVALVVGGSIVIPHFRRAVEYWHQLENEN